jgi:hypothetical protein
MEYKYAYATDQDKANLLQQNSNKVLVEMQDLIEGKFLIFADEPRPTEKIYVDGTKEEIESLKSDNLILMDALATAFEEILVLEDKVNAIGGTTTV